MERQRKHYLIKTILLAGIAFFACNGQESKNPAYAFTTQYVGLIPQFRDMSLRILMGSVTQPYISPSSTEYLKTVYISEPNGNYQVELSLVYLSDEPNSHLHRIVVEHPYDNTGALISDTYPVGSSTYYMTFNYPHIRCKLEQYHEESGYDEIGIPQTNIVVDDVSQTIEVFVVKDLSSPTNLNVLLEPSDQSEYREYYLIRGSADDSGSGIKEISYRWEDGDWIKGSAYRILRNGKLFARATDNVGNNVDSQPIEISTIEDTIPSAPVCSAADTFPSTPTKGPVVIKPRSNDPQSGIARFLYSTDGGSTWAARNPDQGYTFIENGSVACKAVDGAGHEGPSAELFVGNIDNEKPIVSSAGLRLSENGKGLLSWDASDVGSGIADFSVEYSIDGLDAGSYPPASSLNGSSRSLEIDFPGIEAIGRSVAFSVTAVDAAGNASFQRSTETIDVPHGLAMSGLTVFPAGLVEQVDAEYMEVDVELNYSPGLVKSEFSKIKISRSSMDGATIVEREAPTSGFELAESGAVEEPNATWKSVNGHLCLIDRIPVSTGAGNKRWTYSMTPVIGSGAEWLVGQAVDRLVRLPNNRGKLDQFKILDMSGREPGSEGFSVGPGRTVLISIVGSDPDKDDWKIEVDRINRVVQDDFAFTNHASLSGKSRIVYEYSGNYDVLTIPVTLAYGDNNIQLAWSEGDAENDVRSEVRNLVVERDLEGIYRLTVLGEYGDRVACDEDGILCAPGQALTFAISAAGGEDTSRIKWDFGDGTPVETGPIQVHAYHQDQNQASCSLAREVALTLPTEPETIRRVRVIVMDTQIGELYETETWRGDHAVLGRIIVPEGMELHIASGQTVSFQGGSAAGSGQGLLVRPSARLIVDGGVVLKAPEAQSSRWDSIMVQGSAAIGAEAGGSTEIRDAERAVAAAPGSSVTLANVRLAANETGLHIVGSAAVGIDGCEIVGNFLYGIKEDSGGRPVLRNTTLRGNFRDYYSWNGGLLNAEQVNAMPGNAGNRGE